MLQISLNHSYRFLFVRVVNEGMHVCVTMVNEKLNEGVKEQLILPHDRNKFSKAQVIDYKFHLRIDDCGLSSCISLTLMMSLASQDFRRR